MGVEAWHVDGIINGSRTIHQELINNASTTGRSWSSSAGTPSDLLVWLQASLYDRISDESPQVPACVLKWFLSIFSDLIFDSSVDRATPNLAAAPVGPNTRPRLSFRATSIMLFSWSSSL